MNEFIEVQLRRNGKPLRIKRQVAGGIEFDEPDPIERTVGISIDAASPSTAERMNSIRRNQGWEPGQFKLNVGVEDGSLVLRGVNAHSLPEGLYKVQLQIEEAKTVGGAKRADVKHDGKATVTIEVKTDDRDVAVDLSDADEGIRGVLDRSTIDKMKAVRWLEDTNNRPTRQACLLNLLASLRTRPTLRDPLLGLVNNVFVAANDRVYAQVDRTMPDLLKMLADDVSKPFFAEGPPHAAIHGQLLSAIPDPAERLQFKDLLSFRSEGTKGAPSMQVVVALPPAGLAHTYADFDLDLANPLQDLVGFFVHMGELLDGKPTNHLDMRSKLAKTKANDFLYYSVVA